MLFESTWKRKYTTRGIHKVLAKYAAAAGLEKPISPHQLRHFLLTWLKKQGIDDALIQPYSGHSSRQSLEVYSRLSIGEAQEVYNQVMLKFPVWLGLGQLTVLTASLALRLFAEANSEEKKYVAALIGNFANQCCQFPLGSRANNIEIALAAYEAALEVYTRDLSST